MIKIYTINLFTENGRREKILSLAKKLELPIKIENAIIGSNLSKEYLDNLTNESIDKIGRNLSPGEVGCYLSHIKCLKNFLSSGDEFAIILEDDVTLDYRIKDFISTIEFKETTLFFDVMLLGYRNGYGSYWGKKKWNSHKLLRFPDCGYGAHAYLVTRKGAEKIVYNNAIPIWPYDYVTGGRADKTIRVYGVEKKIVDLDFYNSSCSSLEAERNYLGAYSSEYKVKTPFVLHVLKKLIKGLKPIRVYK
ncbi:glycosyltransferase family 25 protein [Escherichia coli]|uniref:glycosyltransferase family 25 protein n=1 Tax=Escherichia coli TaxID=562 RepID=UPI000BE48842|nr:glycosyltransferase family 25 protein [Escherichia coli]